MGVLCDLLLVLILICLLPGGIIAWIDLVDAKRNSMNVIQEQDRWTMSYDDNDHQYV